MPSKPKRKLAAIMFTDMVGYSAPMQEDENGNDSSEKKNEGADS